MARALVLARLARVPLPSAGLRLPRASDAQSALRAVLDECTFLRREGRFTQAEVGEMDTRTRRTWIASLVRVAGGPAT